MTVNSQSITENGEFCIPLYHGTSSLFIDSIQTVGLGAVDPIKEHDGVRLLKELLTIADEVFRSDAEWSASRFVVQWMVDQKSFSGRGNFQHGDTYITPSRASAVGYALTNRFGSEFVTQAHRVYRLIAEREPKALSGEQIEAHPLVALFATDPRPLLVTAHQVPVAAVVSEDGGPAQPSIDHLHDMSSFLKLGIVLNINFRLLTALPPSSLSVEVLDAQIERNPFDC